MSPLKEIEANPLLKETIETLVMEFETIPAERKAPLSQLAEFVERKAAAGEKAELVFICTHNSRRSHISQIWAQTAAAYYGIGNVVSYSGGTEATAFNPRAVAAMEKAGFSITSKTNGENPIYEVFFARGANAMLAYSKKYDAGENPKKDFAAVMTCSHADEHCPIVAGMEQRISLPYDDPKEFDQTPLESAKYLERVFEIGREILFAFSLVKLQK
jgi:arsenate reductase (thioredoxin)